MEWVTLSQMKLKTPGILWWDSFYPVAENSMEECDNLSNDKQKRPVHPSLKYKDSWNCLDGLHMNPGSLVVAVQMLVNQMCNEFMPPDGYCCDRK